MSRQQTLKFTIRQDGRVTEEVMGATSNECVELTRQIDIKLGELETRQFKPEFYSNYVAFQYNQDKAKNKPILQEALEILQYDVKEYQELKVTGAHGIGHETVEAELAIGTDIGFRLNEITGVYELVADLETWNQPISVERFMDKVNQQYARMTVHNTVKKMGFQVEEEWEMEDNSIELTVTRWV